MKNRSNYDERHKKANEKYNKSMKDVTSQQLTDYKEFRREEY